MQAYTIRRRGAVLVCTVALTTAVAACGSGMVSGGATNGASGAASSKADSSAAPAKAASCSKYNYSNGFASKKPTLNYDSISSLGKLNPKSDVRVGVVLKTLANQYWSEVKRGALAAGKLYGVKVTVQAAQSEASQNQQLTIAQTMENQNYDAYVFSPETNSNLGPFIKDIEKKCLPLVNIIEPGVVAMTYVGADEVGVGKAAADYLAKVLPKNAKVAFIAGQAGSDAGADRAKGFKQEAKAKGLDFLGSGVGNWDQTTAYNATQQILQRFPKVQGIFAANDTMSLGVAQAVKAAHADVVIDSTDGIPATIDLIRKGQIASTLTPFPYYQGCTAVEAALRALAGQKVPPWVQTSPTLITKKNVDELYKSDGKVKSSGTCQPPASK